MNVMSVSCAVSTGMLWRRGTMAVSEHTMDNIDGVWKRRRRRRRRGWGGAGGGGGDLES